MADAAPAPEATKVDTVKGAEIVGAAEPKELKPDIDRKKRRDEASKKEARRLALLNLAKEELAGEPSEGKDVGLETELLIVVGMDKIATEAKHEGVLHLVSRCRTMIVKARMLEGTGEDYQILVDDLKKSAKALQDLCDQYDEILSALTKKLRDEYVGFKGRGTHWRVQDAKALLAKISKVVDVDNEPEDRP